MGKYQLDDKGKALVLTIPLEKHSKGGVNKKTEQLALRTVLNKNKKSESCLSLFLQREEYGTTQTDIADKETVLDMMAEFEKGQSAHDGFWDAEVFLTRIGQKLT